MTSAKIIADSCSPNGKRLTTIEVTMHRFVLAEFNTHRVFSRNSASSRAIPLREQIRRLNESTAFPVVWPTEQRGMQGGPPLDKQDSVDAMHIWEEARDFAIEQANRLFILGVHKSVINRLLEPFMWHTVIVTATDWENFWGLRCHEMAQPEIRVAAEAMKAAYDASEPSIVGWHQWHLPYVTDEDRAEHALVSDLQMISVARCAWVSTMSHDGDHSFEACARMFERLTTAEPMHASPLEHQARPLYMDEYPVGNFRSWLQLRHMVEDQKARERKKYL